jgi:hypothetical protein
MAEDKLTAEYGAHRGFLLSMNASSFNSLLLRTRDHGGRLGGLGVDHDQMEVTDR